MSLYTQHACPQRRITHSNFPHTHIAGWCTQKAFTHTEHFYTQHMSTQRHFFTQQIFTHRSYNTQGTFPQRSFYTQQTLPQKNFYTEKLLRSSYTYKPSETGAFTHGSFYTEKLYTEKRSHIEPFTD